MCFVHDYDITWHDVKIVRARRPHRCDECGGAIAKGDYQQSCSFFDPGVGPGRNHFCDRCVHMAARIYAEEIADGCRPHESFPPMGDGELGETYRAYMRGDQ